MFKDRLKALREKEGLSQQALADKLFVSRSAIAKWENGNGIPSDVNLEAICKFFDAEEEWLVDRMDIKEVFKKLDKENNKVIWLVIGIVIPLVLIILSLFPIFKYSGLLTWFVYPRSIFSFINESYSVIVLIALILYLYEIIFSFVYRKKEIKNGKLIQIINLSLVILCFAITFVLANAIAIDNSFKLFFLFP